KLGGPVVEGAVNGITSLVYRSIHAVTRVTGEGIDVALARLAPLLGPMESSSPREAVVPALNGGLGDHLAETANPLALTMQCRRPGRPVALGREGLATAFPLASGRVMVLVHGLCMSPVAARSALPRDRARSEPRLHAGAPPLQHRPARLDERPHVGSAA